MHALVAAVHAQHLDVSVTIEPVSHRPACAQSRRSTNGRLHSTRRLDRNIPAAAAAAAAEMGATAATQGRLECASELERHDVVEYRVDDGTNVVENA